MLYKQAIQASTRVWEARGTGISLRTPRQKFSSSPYLHTMVFPVCIRFSWLNLVSIPVSSRVLIFFYIFGYFRLYIQNVLLNCGNRACIWTKKVKLFLFAVRIRFCSHGKLSCTRVTRIPTDIPTQGHARLPLCACYLRFYTFSQQQRPETAATTPFCNRCLAIWRPHSRRGTRVFTTSKMQRSILPIQFLLLLLCVRTNCLHVGQFQRLTYRITYQDPWFILYPAALCMLTCADTSTFPRSSLFASSMLTVGINYPLYKICEVVFLNVWPPACRNIVGVCQQPRLTYMR